jgi:hypothetical protein
MTTRVTVTDSVASTQQNLKPESNRSENAQGSSCKSCDCITKVASVTLVIAVVVLFVTTLIDEESLRERAISSTPPVPARRLRLPISPVEEQLKENDTSSTSSSPPDPPDPSDEADPSDPPDPPDTQPARFPHFPGGFKHLGNKKPKRPQPLSWQQHMSLAENTTRSFFQSGSKQLESSLRHLRSFPHCERVRFGLNASESGFPKNVKSTVDAYLSLHRTTFDELPPCTSDSGPRRYFTASRDIRSTGIGHQTSQLQTVIKTAYSLGFVAAVPVPNLSAPHNGGHYVPSPTWAKYVDLSRIVMIEGGRPKCRMHVITREQIPPGLKRVTFRADITRKRMLQMQKSDADVIENKFTQMMWRENNYAMRQLDKEKNGVRILYNISPYATDVAKAVASLLGENTIAAHLRRGDRKGGQCEKYAYFGDKKSLADRCSTSPVPHTLAASTEPKQLATAIRTLEKRYDTLYVLTNEKDPQFVVDLRKEIDMCVITEKDMAIFETLQQQLSDNYFVFIAQRALQYQFSMQIVTKPNSRLGGDDVQLLNVHGCRVPWGTVPGILPKAALRNPSSYHTVMTLC